MSSLSSLLNPPSIKQDSKTTVEDIKTKITAPDSAMPSDINSTINNSSVTESAASTKKESKRKRKFFLKDSQKDAEPRDNKNYQTLLINSRSRHLKKNDGEPYWRNEIQFEFLMRLFFNYKRVFKNPYFDTSEGFDWPDHFRSFKDENGNLCQNNGEHLTFFELYLITLLKSSKISKILKARLMLDINYALNFSIICLLVNIGRLNTTVNFDHEMKSQFRTYHSIPSLQVGNHLQIIERYYQIQESSQKLFNDEDTATNNNNNNNISDDAESLKDDNLNSNNSIRGGSGYTMTTVKQLQDTPRIKSILKSINDLNTVIPKSFKEFIIGTSDDNKFDLNIISLTFLLCVHEFDIGRSFFPNAVQLSSTELNELKSQNKPISTGSLFNDIWLRPDFKPVDKVNRFLWLIYLFKETNFQIDKLIKNPFNKEDQLFHLHSLNSDANLAAEITSENHFLTHKARQVIPDLHFQDSNEPIDSLVNDFDTPDEVEFAGHMKRLRTEFVDFENQGRDDSKKDEYYEYGDESDESENNDHPQQIHSEQDQSNPQQALLQPQPILASFNQNYNQTEDYKFNSNSNSNSHSTEVFNSYDNSNTLSPVLESAINAATCNTAFKKRKSRLTTVEAGAADPLSLLQYDDTNNNTNKKKKRVKKPVIELPIRLNTKELENLLNSEIKSINSNSKNAVMKRQRNRIVGEFLMDMFNYKITKFRNLRLKEGNWKNWILNGQHDMNLLIERDTIDNENIINENENANEDRDAEYTDLKSKFNYGNFGEFKITLFKAFTKINNVINAREIILRDEKDDTKEPDFLDNLFSKI